MRVQTANRVANGQKLRVQDGIRLDLAWPVALIVDRQPRYIDEFRIRALATTCTRVPGKDGTQVGTPSDIRAVRRLGRAIKQEAVDSHQELRLLADLACHACVLVLVILASTARKRPHRGPVPKRATDEQDGSAVNHCSLIPRVTQSGQ